MEHKENILIVHNYYQISGGEDTVVANEKRMLEDYGHKVTLYTRNNSEILTMSIKQKLLLPFITIFNLKTYKDVIRLIREEKIEIVHVHNTLNLISPAVYYAAKKSKVPIVQTIHNFRLLCPAATFYRNDHICEDCVSKGLKCAVANNCYRNSKIQTLACVINTVIHRITGIYGKINYICLTDFNKEKLLTLKQIKKEKVFVKPNFVENGNEIATAEQRAFQVVFCGRLDKLKGVDILFEAWKQLGTNAPKLVVCGMGPMEEWCRKFIKENKCNIELKGFVSNQEALKIIGISKALILPTQWYEGFPMSIVEAFSTGTPVICSNLGNCGALIEEGINGYKIYDNTPSGLAKAVQKLLLGKELYSSVECQFKNKYTKYENYRQLKKIYGCVKE